MNKIIFPLNYGDEGNEVHDLQDALQLFIDKNKLLLDERDKYQYNKYIEKWKSECRGKQYGEITKILVDIFQHEQKLQNIECHGVVDKVTATAINTLLEKLCPPEEKKFIVKGTVRHINGSPAGGIKVSAFDTDLKTEKLLGEEVKTNEKGCYQISYTSRQLLKPEKGSADLIVKAFAADGSVLVVSQVTCNAPLEATVDLSIPDKEKKYIVKGTVRHINGSPACGIKVSAFDTDSKIERLLGKEEKTNELGFYQISYTSSHLLKPDKGSADLVVKAFSADGSVLIKSEVMTKAPLEAVIDLTIPEEEKKFIVKGHVRELDGTPFVKGQVMAYDKGLGTIRTLLGKTGINNCEGFYEISYTTRNLKKDSVNLLVEAVNEKNEPITLPHDVIYRARLEETVELTIDRSKYRGHPEYKRLENKVLSAFEGMSLIKLTSPDDIKVVASNTDLDVRRIENLVEAARFAERTKLSSEIGYVLASQNVPISSLSTVLQQDESTIRRILGKAIEENVISEKPEGFIEETLKQFRELAIGEQLEGNLGGILKASPSLSCKPELQKAFVDEYLNNRSFNDFFWEELKKRPEFKDENLQKELKFTIDLGQTARNHLPLVQTLGEELNKAGSPDNLRVLASWSLKRWKEVIEKTGFPQDTPGDDDEQKASNFAESRFREIEARFPTAVIAHRLKQEKTENKTVPEDSEVLLKYIERHEDFELTNTDIDKLVDLDEPSKSSLKSWQRAAAISPKRDRYDILRSLKMVGLDSAVAIASMGRGGLEQYSDMLGGTEKTEAVWNKSRFIYSSTLSLYTEFRDALNISNPRMVPNAQINSLPDDFSEKPTLQALFGSLDFCECEHCKSIYSPAAYFVDLLQFLKNASKKNGRHPLNVLLNRRPDLAEIEFSCENTNTQIPYVDLVSEILENAVSGFSINSYHYIDLNNEVITDKLRKEFSDAGHALSKSVEPVLIKIEENKRWKIIDDINLYIILAGDTFDVYPLGNYQTKGRKEELSAQPEHSNLQAYVKLTNQSYPWSLPFDLWFEEARTYMKHLGFERDKWMKLILPASKSLDISCDSLGLTDLERELILGYEGPVDPAKEKDLWDIRGWQEIDVLCNLKLLREKAGLESEKPGESYKVINRLVYTYFINPKGRLHIEFSGNPCDLVNGSIVHWAEPERENVEDWDWTVLFNKIRRFLRLQRKLGWTIEELDKAISAFETKNLDEIFLKRLSNIKRLQAELKVPLIEMFSWWGLIDVAEDRSEEEESKKTKSLYEQVFLNKSVNNPSNALFELNYWRTGMLIEGLTDDEVKKRFGDKLITTHAVEIAGPLGISVADLMLLVADLMLLLEKGVNDEGVPNKLELNLKTLTELYRTVSLSKALKIDIKDFIAAKSVIGIDPFLDTKTDDVVKDRTENTLRFIEQIRKIQSSGFSIAELDYLLHHNYNLAEDLFVPTNGDIAKVLAEISSGLFKIEAETTIIPDSEGKMTEKRLALIIPEDAGQIVNLLRGRETYSAPLNKLPSEIKFDLLPDRFDELKKRISFDINAHKLRIIGLMTDADKTALIDLDKSQVPNLEYRNAIEKVYNEPRTIIEIKLKTIPGLVEALKQAMVQKIDPNILLSITLDKISAYILQNFVKQQLATSYQIDADLIGLLTNRLVKSLLDPKETIIYDFLKVSKGGISANYYTTNDLSGTSTKQIEPTIDINVPLNVPNNTQSIRWYGMLQAEKSDTYDFHVQTMGNVRLWLNDRLMLDTGAKHTEEVNKFISVELEAGKFYPLKMEYFINSGEGKAKLSWKSSFFEEQVIPQTKLLPCETFTSYLLLHKIILLIKKFKIRADELIYLSEHKDHFLDFDLNKFPVDNVKQATDHYKLWERLREVFSFRDHYIETDIRLIDIFAMAAASQGPIDADKDFKAAKEKLLALTKWNEKDLNNLADKEVFNLTVEDLRGGNKLEKLHQAFTVLRLLGISAEQLISWVKTDLGANPYKDRSSLSNTESMEEYSKKVIKAKESMVQSLKQVIKAKYSQEQWLKIFKPLQDSLREKKRSALVAYLVHEYRLENSSDLYARFLIDVEMDPCMMTSRIKQAISSVQLFVQRSLMNLEIEVSFSPVDSDQWKWRKNYRVWEANRKVFLYPENWIEPELRDDKSPFFRELESELLQKEITDEAAEIAFAHYLEKLDEVAKLEIASIYEDEDEKTLHVFGRTDNSPRVYYYRQRVNEPSYWTPWEQVDLDIEGDHLIPLKWNGRLYLFWLIFSEKPLKQEPEGTPKTNLEVQFAWSEYISGRWSPKRTVPSVTIPYGRKENLRDYTILVNNTSQEKIYFDLFRTYYNPINTISDYQYIFDFKSNEMSDNTPYIDDILLPPRNSRFEGMTCLQFFDLPLDYKNLSVPIGIANKDHPYLPVADYQHILYNTPSKFRILFPPKIPKILDVGKINYSFCCYYCYLEEPFFYEDDNRTFLVTSREGDKRSKIDRFYTFNIFYHPYINEFIKQFNLKGLPGLLKPSYKESKDLYRQSGVRKFFAENYGVTYPNYPNSPYFLPPSYFPENGKELVEDIDFVNSGAYSLYNWELFFHAPLLIAERLSNNQRFEEAMKWFHYIFDPTLVPYDPEKEPFPERFWMVKPFFELYLKEGGIPKRIQELLTLLNQRNHDMENQIKAWMNDPFKPHLIARMRLQAYMLNVVMRYIDNIIAWADQLFRRETIESINEATQLYILAADILGPYPHIIPAREHKNWTYSMLETEDTYIDLMSNFQTIENKISRVLWSVQGQTYYDFEPQLPSIESFYFCIPNNEKLLQYWTTVNDRLLKIRHCMSIEGKVRELPLFEPQIDPALLVRAAAAGIDISSVLNDLYAPLSNYRFNVILQKAVELCSEVKVLGSSLLSALEKKDAEDLALLRSSQEITLLNAIEDIKDKQLKEAIETKAGLEKAQDLLEKIRIPYYMDKLGLIERPKPGDLVSPKVVINDQEKIHSSRMEEARNYQDDAEDYNLAAQIVGAVLPDFIFGNDGPFPTFQMNVGRTQVVIGLQAHAQLLNDNAATNTYQATMAITTAGYQRRSEEWALQLSLACQELEQIKNQILAADIRIQIAENEQKNHKLQIENAKEIKEYMHSKFTNKELYNWMVNQISSVYFQSYQLAYDIAKRAEKDFRHELGLDDSNFIQFGYWDNLKMGLLSGEKLYYDLRRMEMAYLEQNKREYEMTKHVSLLQVDPLALIQLRTTGRCIVRLPEELFDIDCPGHYFRRIKTVAVSIPCVTGPYVSINCTLTLMKSSIRKKPIDSSSYPRNDVEDSRFSDDFASLQSTVTSSAQNDSGMFETNLRDERYLPFEGSGVISEWMLELPADPNPSKNEPCQFDYNTISDVILHIRYTAREGGSELRKEAMKNLITSFGEENATGSLRLFSVRHEFPTEWADFQRQKPGKNNSFKLTLNLRPEHYPFWSQRVLKSVNHISIIIHNPNKHEIKIFKDVDKNDTENLEASTEYGGLLFGEFTKSQIPIPSTPISSFELFFDYKEVENIWVAVAWSSKEKI